MAQLDLFCGEQKETNCSVEEIPMTTVWRKVGFSQTTSEVTNNRSYAQTSYSDLKNKTSKSAGAPPVWLWRHIYHNFSAPGDHIFDPFAGGPVRGCVATDLGRRYCGVDIREEQVSEDRKVCPEATYIHADGLTVIRQSSGVDLVASCPPYWCLERYSRQPEDISNVSYEEFCDYMGRLTAEAVARARRWVIWDLGDMRYKGSLLTIPFDVAAAAARHGARLHDYAVVNKPGGLAKVVWRQRWREQQYLAREHSIVLIWRGTAPRRDEC